jgi:hypothetical protein
VTLADVALFGFMPNHADIAIIRRVVPQMGFNAQ